MELATFRERQVSDIAKKIREASELVTKRCARCSRTRQWVRS